MVEHKAGKRHLHADALSRVRVNAVQPTQELVWEPIWDNERIRREQREDAQGRGVIEHLEGGADDVDFYLEDGLFHRRGEDRVAAPQSMRRRVMEVYHSLPWAAHMGVRRTTAAIARRFYWPRMARDIRGFIRRCQVCQRHKTPPGVGRAPVQAFKEVTRPWQRCGMDITGPFVASGPESARYVLVVECHFSKFVEAIPIPDQKAETVARALVERVILVHGAPQQLLSDCGRNLTGDVMARTCELLRVRRIHTVAYAPWQNGEMERWNRTFKQCLSMVVKADQRNWAAWVPYVTFAYRTSVHDATNETPFYLMYGRDPDIPVDEFVSAQGVRYGEDYASELARRLAGAYEQVRNCLRQRGERRRARCNEGVTIPNFQEGSIVSRRLEAPTPGLSSKLAPKWSGTLRIAQKLGEVTYRVRPLHGRGERIVHARQLKPYVAGDDATAEPPAEEATRRNPWEDASRAKGRRRRGRPRRTPLPSPAPALGTSAPPQQGAVPPVTRDNEGPAASASDNPPRRRRGRPRKTPPGCSAPTPRGTRTQKEAESDARRSQSADKAEIEQRPGVRTRAGSRRDRTEEGLELRASGSQTSAYSVAKIQPESTGVNFV